MNRAYGYVFQAAALYPWRTIARNVSLPLEIMGLDAGTRERRVAENLQLVNLEGFEKKFPWQLSGGMQQRASTSILWADLMPCSQKRDLWRELFRVLCV